MRGYPFSQTSTVPPSTGIQRGRYPVAHTIQSNDSRAPEANAAVPSDRETTGSASRRETIPKRNSSFRTLSDEPRI